MRRFWIFLAGILTLAGCSPLPIQRFAGSGPALDPVRFFTGHLHSWGVIENRDGGPTEIIQTDCIGEPEGPDGVHMVQRLTFGDGTVQTRDWHMRRTAPHGFEATANDMIGTAHGTAAGRAFHWTWSVQARSGNPLSDVTLDQWMYLLDDGSVMNRSGISKLGVQLAQVSEVFEKTK
jgi:hypothetical protein